MAGTRANTKQRIQDAAFELFISQGVRQTSLQQIAQRLGMTKPALYYYFESRDELVASLVTPMIEDMEATLPQLEYRAPDPRQLLDICFDFYLRHRRTHQLLVREMSLLATLDIGSHVMDWRERVTRLLVPDDDGLPARARAVVALGGLADCTLVFPDADPEDLRHAAIDAALAALRGEAG